MHAHHRARTLPTLLAAVGLALAVAACGDDDTASPPPTSADPASGDFCAAATELSQSEEPTEAQVSAYVSSAPEEVAGPAATLDALYRDHELGSVDHYVARADDAVEGAFAALAAYETTACGIDNSELATDVAVSPGAARVDVVATDFAFDLPAALPAGPTSFVLTNDGAEAHLMMLFRMGAGHNFEEAMAFEGDAQEAGLVEEQRSSGFAAPGGTDEEFVTMDLRPGSYAMACFLPSHDGTPHAMSGMVSSFTVS